MHVDPRIFHLQLSNLVQLMSHRFLDKEQKEYEQIGFGKVELDIYVIGVKF